MSRAVASTRPISVSTILFPRWRAHGARRAAPDDVTAVRVVIREVLSLERLQALSPEEAAAMLLVRQDMSDDDGDDAVFEA